MAAKKTVKKKGKKSEEEVSTLKADEPGEKEASLESELVNEDKIEEEEDEEDKGFYGEKKENEID